MTSQRPRGGELITLKENFQDGVDAVYDAVVAKGSTPASKALADVIAGIANIPAGITPSGTLDITTNGTKDVTNYANVSVEIVPTLKRSDYRHRGSIIYNIPSTKVGDIIFVGISRDNVPPSVTGATLIGSFSGTFLSGHAFRVTSSTVKLDLPNLPSGEATGYIYLSCT
jgi:hypothetical protein